MLAARNKRAAEWNIFSLLKPPPVTACTHQHVRSILSEPLWPDMLLSLGMLTTIGTDPPTLLLVRTVEASYLLLKTIL